MNCPDCKADGREVSCDFDSSQMGNVCMRCGRVYSPLLGSSQKHYISKEKAQARMKRDEAERLHGMSTAAVVKRILRPTD